MSDIYQSGIKCRPTAKPKMVLHSLHVVNLISDGMTIVDGTFGH